MRNAQLWCSGRIHEPKVGIILNFKTLHGFYFQLSARRQQACEGRL
jgi:hypothetical protein